MGYGFVLKCKACDYEQRVLLGAGMMTPSLAAEAFEAMKVGEYGRSFQKTAALPGAAAYLSKELFVCPSCGAFEVGDDVSLCLPKEGHEPEECTEPVLFGPELEDEYEVVLTVEHSCAKCGDTMKKAEGHRDLCCPRCRGELTRGAGGMILWD